MTPPIAGRKVRKMSDIRTGRERRQQPTPLFNRYLLRGRRVGPRRSCDARQNFYVDRFADFEWKIILLLCILCSADAILTIIHLSNGSRELNPILNTVYQYCGSGWFVAYKLGLTLPCIAILLLHARFPLSRLGIKLLVAIYSMLIVYQLQPLVLGC
jgi:hypothetical protein